MLDSVWFLHDLTIVRLAMARGRINVHMKNSLGRLNYKSLTAKGIKEKTQANHDSMSATFFCACVCALNNECYFRLTNDMSSK